MTKKERQVINDEKFKQEDEKLLAKYALSFSGGWVFKAGGLVTAATSLYYGDLKYTAYSLGAIVIGEALNGLSNIYQSKLLNGRINYHNERLSKLEKDKLEKTVRDNTQSDVFSTTGNTTLINSDESEGGRK